MNLFSTNNQRNDLKIRINRGRYNLLFVVLMSVINIFLISSSSQMLLPYSSSISNYSVALGISESLKSGNDSLRILGLVVACGVLMVIMVCYILSKSKPFYLVISLSIFVADTIVLATLEGASGSLASPYVILDLVIHLLAIFYIFSGIKAAKELRALPDEDDNNQSEIATSTAQPFDEADDYEEDIVTDDVIDEEEEEEEEDLTQPIGKYVDDGTEPLVQGVYDNLNVFAIIRDDKAELVINGFVCDELDVSYESEFQLRAFVNDIDFTFDYKETERGKVMYLYADDELIDSLGLS